MNGPYPPVVPPKPPNIGVSQTVDVTSTGKPGQNEKAKERQDQPKSTEEDVTTSTTTTEPTRKKRSNTRTSVFAESLEPQPAQNKSKPEPRIEPPGFAYRGPQPGTITQEISLTRFLREQPPAPVQVAEPKKHPLKNLLRPSNSERKLLSESKRNMAAAVAKKRTSEGRGYAQIVTKGLYEIGQNKSAYQINLVEEAGGRFKRSKSRNKRLGHEMVKSVKKREPIESLSGDGESKVVTSDEMADSIQLNLNDGQRKEEALREEREKEQRKREMSPAPMLPPQKGGESNLSIDFSSILKRHEEAIASPKKVKRGSLNTSLMTRSESRPNVRDFAGEASSNFIRSAFRRRSRSPMKKSPMKENPDRQSHFKQSPGKTPDKKRDRKIELPRAPLPPSYEVPDHSVYRRRINSIRDSDVHQAGVGALIPLGQPEPNDGPQSIVADGQTQPAISKSQRSSGNSSNTKNSSTSNGHSKSASGISAGSNENDNLSEVSSAIISDAQSISIHKTNGSSEWVPSGNLARKQMRPGPAPTGPLPSLPEGHDVQLPSTPRHSGSIQRPSPERSPPKSRQKTQPRYRFIPPDESPGRVPQSPPRIATAAKPEEPAKKPAALVRIQTADLSDFPTPPLPSPERKPNSKRQAIAAALSSTLSTSTSDTTLANRAERTKKLKAKDLALERSKSPTPPFDPPPPLPSTQTIPSINTHRGGHEGHKDSLDYLIDSYDTSFSQNPWRRPTSAISAISSTIHDTHRSSAHLSSEISPIIVLAEQEPVVVPSRPQPTVGTASSEYADGSDAHITPVLVVEQGHHSSDPGLEPSSAIELQLPDSRPVSGYSVHQQKQHQHYPDPPAKSPHRSFTNPIANRPATPYFPVTAGGLQRPTSEYFQGQDYHLLNSQNSQNLQRQNSLSSSPNHQPSHPSSLHRQNSHHSQSHNSHHSSRQEPQHSSLHRHSVKSLHPLSSLPDSADLESRMHVLEQRNHLLEQAFLRVIDAASVSLSSGSQGRESGLSFEGAGGRWSGNGGENFESGNWAEGGGGLNDVLGRGESGREKVGGGVVGDGGGGGEAF